MSFSLAHIMELILLYKYAFLLLIVIIEGPIATILAGFITSLGELNFLLAYITVVVGDLIGDVLYYGIGYWGRTGFIEKWGKYLGLHADRIAQLERHFQKHSGKTLVIGKFSHGIGGAVLVAAGMARISLVQYLWYNTVAAIPKSLALLLIGYYFGHAYTQIDHYFVYAAAVMTGLAILTGVMYTFLHKMENRLDS